MYERDGDFQYRQFAVTKKGFLTVGPQAMQPGDLICLLHGGELPYILRPAQEKYHFLGECYVHDLNLQRRNHPGKDLELEWFFLA
jgi:hypothetical protein